MNIKTSLKDREEIVNSFLKFIRRHVYCHVNHKLNFPTIIGSLAFYRCDSHSKRYSFIKILLPSPNEVTGI